MVSHNERNNQASDIADKGQDFENCVHYSSFHLFNHASRNNALAILSYTVLRNAIAPLGHALPYTTVAFQLKAERNQASPLLFRASCCHAIAPPRRTWRRHASPLPFIASLRFAFAILDIAIPSIAVAVLHII